VGISGTSEPRTNCPPTTLAPVVLRRSLGLDRVKTFSHEGDTVLDNAAGLSTTVIAALNTFRSFICIEKDEKYFELSKQRIAEKIKAMYSNIYSDDITKNETNDGDAKAA
jgi:site-specific DNA-methyltransferase (adenine-specific)